MSKGSDEEGGWGTTEAIQVITEASERARAQRIEDAVEDALGREDITEAKLPLKVVVALVVWIVGQVIAGGSLWSDVTSDIRSLKERQAGLTNVLMDKDLETLRLEIDNLKSTLVRIESNVSESPTSLENMRAVGQMQADIRVIEKRLEYLERSIR